MQALRVWFDGAGAGEAGGGGEEWDLRIVPIAWHCRGAMLGTVVSNLGRSRVPVVLRVTVLRRDRGLRRRVRDLRRRVDGRSLAIVVDVVAEGTDVGRGTPVDRRDLKGRGEERPVLPAL